MISYEQQFSLFFLVTQLIFPSSNTFCECVDDNSARSSLMVLYTIYCFWLYMAAVLCVKCCQFSLFRDIFPFLRGSSHHSTSSFHCARVEVVTLEGNKWLFFFLNFLFSLLFMETSFYSDNLLVRSTIKKESFTHNNRNSLPIPCYSRQNRIRKWISNLNGINFGGSEAIVAMSSLTAFWWQFITFKPHRKKLSSLGKC